ncbi:NAD(P)H-hydrate dehydratase [uncultured Sphingomonas sp.]|uniref:NAD(P)H-hydrate dehydratase n=1 Tax=uncultured Sphingomonas sp. TaxID=158754 RepID=UPI0025CD551B|nr:NAD(P)H-hydrate dehydratase [uncultured Sphingomonas sp.]
MTPRPVLTAVAMRAAEEQAMARGASVDALMERAGRVVAEAAWRLAGAAPTLIFCGPGNNGGDGYVAARFLEARGVPVRVIAIAPPATDAAKAAAAAWGGEAVGPEACGVATLVIDAVFGTGLKRPMDQSLAELICQQVKAARWSVAVDLPSGISTDDGMALGKVSQFDMTVALGALKPAHLLLPGAERCGRIVVGDIGLGAIASDLVEVARPCLPAPRSDDNKYSRGKVLVVAGAMPGASALAAGAAQRAGAGYVELAGVSGDHAPHALVRRPRAAEALDDARVGAVVIGSGLGRDAEARAKLDAALACGRPLVLDADALTLIGTERHDRLRGHVLTPHWGEYVRLFGDDGRDRLTQARAAAAASGAIVLLKGADSIVAHPDGRAAIAPRAPGWLASAGTGDVLAGIVGAMIARGLNPFAAAQAAPWLHAEAARIAGAALIADDLIACLPRAVAACL